MQKLVSFSVDDFVVNGVKQRVLFASSDAVKKVSVIKTLGSFGSSGASAVGLTAAVYASAGTSHDLDKVEVLACLDSFKKVVCVSKAAYYSDLELLLTVGRVNSLIPSLPLCPALAMLRRAVLLLLEVTLLRTASVTPPVTPKITPAQEVVAKGISTASG